MWFQLASFPLGLGLQVSEICSTSSIFPMNLADLVHNSPTLRLDSFRFRLVTRKCVLLKQKWSFEEPHVNLFLAFIPQNSLVFRQLISCSKQRTGSKRKTQIRAVCRVMERWLTQRLLLFKGETFAGMRVDPRRRESLYREQDGRKQERTGA